MSAPDFDKETWHCNACEEDFEVKVGSYDLNKDEWPKCSFCMAENTDMI